MRNSIAQGRFGAKSASSIVGWLRHFFFFVSQSVFGRGLKLPNWGVVFWEKTWCTSVLERGFSTTSKTFFFGYRVCLCDLIIMCVVLDSISDYYLLALTSDTTVRRTFNREKNDSNHLAYACTVHCSRTWDSLVTTTRPKGQGNDINNNVEYVLQSVSLEECSWEPSKKMSKICVGIAAIPNLACVVSYTQHICPMGALAFFLASSLTVYSTTTTTTKHNDHVISDAFSFVFSAWTMFTTPPPLTHTDTVQQRVSTHFGIYLQVYRSAEFGDPHWRAYLIHNKMKVGAIVVKVEALSERAKV